MLDRLSSEQRAKSLHEANRFRYADGSMINNNQAISSTDSDTSVEQINSSDIDESKVKNKVLILSELEISINEDLKLEKVNLENAKKELENSEFLLIEKDLNDRIFDLQELLTEVKSAKLAFLSDKLNTIKEEPEEDLKPFGYSFFNEFIQTSIDRGVTSIPSSYRVGSEIIWKFNYLDKKTLLIQS